MAVRTLYLIRHGSFEKDGQWGKLGPPLNAKGRKQARRTASVFRGLPVDALYASTLTRARQTAGIIAEELGVDGIRGSRLLHEVHPVALPDVTYEPGDEEIIAEHRKRAERSFEVYFKSCRKDRTEIIVAHGNMIRFLALKSLGAPLVRWPHLGVDCCGISSFAILSGRETYLLSYNEIQHLPPSLRTDD